MRYSWGELEVDIICESVAEFFLASEFFPQFDANAIVHRRERLQPGFLTSDNRLRLSIHSWLLRAGDLNILIDTCVGNQKKRPSITQWNQAEFSYLDGLTETGCSVEDIDIVMCTHLHVDHVGWNTTLINEKWVPTFKNAEYLFAKDEWKYTEQQSSKDPHYNEFFIDSIEPIKEAGLIRFVETNEIIWEEVTLEPTLGHTPGHVSVRIESEGEKAAITGDFLHHPSQMEKLDWESIADWDANLAKETRRKKLKEYSEEDILVFGTHFASPSAGKVIKKGDHFEFDVK